MKSDQRQDHDELLGAPVCCGQVMGAPDRFTVALAIILACAAGAVAVWILWFHS